MVDAESIFFHDLRYSRLKLRSPVSIRPGISISERQSLFISFRSASGQLLFGECPPLPGVHEESIDEAAACLLESVEQGLREIQLNWSKGIQWQEAYFGLFSGPTMPSVKFALEQILWQAIFFACPSSPLYQRMPQSFEANLASLIHLQAEQERADSATVYKIKIGRESLRKELQKTRKILQKHAGRLRLDANQSLDLDDIATLAEAIDPGQVELLEEPFVTDDPAWQSYSGPFPLAMDESLWSKSPAGFTISPWLKKLVLKPARLGISTSIAWWQTLQNPSEDAVLSSCYESGWSLMLYLQMAAYFHLKAALGLGTYDYLEDDVLCQRLNLSAGRHQIDLSLPKLDLNRLHPYRRAESR